MCGVYNARHGEPVSSEVLCGSVEDVLEGEPARAAPSIWDAL